ncbi:hypothetical protein FQZ97_553930 [compost metagenome]
MSGRGAIHLAALCAALAVSGLTKTASAETVVMPPGLSVVLPEGWALDGSPEGVVSKSGLRRVQFACESDACEETQETCTILTRDEQMEGDDDAGKLREMYASPLKRYSRLRAVLRATGPDAEIRKPLERVRIGDRDWYRVETDARHNYKSGLYAETVIDGRYVGVICKSCETGEERHASGLQIMQRMQPNAKAAARH